MLYSKAKLVRMAKENPEAFKALVPSLRGELRKTAAANTLTAVTDFLNRLWPC